MYGVFSAQENPLLLWGVHFTNKGGTVPSIHCTVEKETLSPSTVDTQLLLRTTTTGWV